MDTSTKVILDRALGLRNAGGAERLYQELCDLFVADAPRLMALVRGAVAARSPSDLQQAAHALRGAAQQIGAQCVAERAKRLEQMGKTSSLDGAEAEERGLIEEIKQLLIVLNRAESQS